MNIYGGRRVFIYYAENAKSKDLAATLNAIYGGRETGPTTSGTSPTDAATAGRAARRRRRRPRRPPGPPVAGGGATIAELGLIEGQVRFIADETTNAVIVTTFPRNWAEIEATIKQLDRHAAPGADRGAGRRDHAHRRHCGSGVDWAIKRARSGVGAADHLASATIRVPSSLAADPRAPAGPPAGGGLTAFAFAADKFFAMLNALASENRVNVLSSPHVMTSENKKAVINVSDSIPIVTSQQVPIGAGTASGPDGDATRPPSCGTPDRGVPRRRRDPHRHAAHRRARYGGPGRQAGGQRRRRRRSRRPARAAIIKREAETSVVLAEQPDAGAGRADPATGVAARTAGIPFFKNIPILGYLFGAKDPDRREDGAAAS